MNDKDPHPVPVAGFECLSLVTQDIATHTARPHSDKRSSGSSWWVGRSCRRRW
jgi:hypothetical protein